MKENQIIQNIVNKQKEFEKTLGFKSSYLITNIRKSTPFYKLLIVYYETELIKPHKGSLKGSIEFYKKNKFLGYNKNTFDKYVSLTRFQSGLDKLYCDWCAITNGINEMILASKKFIYSKRIFKYYE